MACWRRKLIRCVISRRRLNRELCQFYHSWKEVEQLLSNEKGKCGKKRCEKKK